MSIRCVFRTPENLKKIDELLDKFPYMKGDREIMIAHVSGWQSKHLKENEDRFPEPWELNEYLRNSPKAPSATAGAKEDLAKQPIGWARTAEDGYEVSTKGDRRFSAFVASFDKGTIIDGVDVGGRTIEDVFQHVIKESGKDLAPSKDSKLYRAPVSSYSGDITPNVNTIFVFGSNPEGRHGAGAAKVAREKFGAIYGQGEGLQGNAYALPTKDLRVRENNSLRSIPEGQIIESIKKLYDVARQNPSKQFKIAYRNTTTASLNGYTGLEMIDMFLKAGSIPSNIVFSKEWVDTGKFNLSKKALEDFSYTEGYLPLWQEWARQNPKLIEELRVKAQGKTLTDWFAYHKENGKIVEGRVSQARALAEILNSTKDTANQGLINESEAYRRMNIVLQDLIAKMDSSGIKEATAARNLYSWTIQANKAIIDAINKGERKDEAISLDKFQDTINNLASKTPKELGDSAIKALKEMSKDFGRQNRLSEGAERNPPEGTQEGQLTEFEAPQVQSFAEDIAKVSQTFNPITRKNIVNKIGRMFSNEVTRLLEEKKEELNRRIEAAANLTVKRELIDELKNLSRFGVIKRTGPYNIFKEIEGTFRVYAEASFDERYELELELINSNPNNDSLSDNMKQNLAKIIAKRKGDTYRKILDNFQVLAEEASSSFALTEGISMDINPDYNYVARDSNTDLVDENGESQDSSVENKEERYKDSWMTDVREVSTFNSLSNRVRRAINNIARVNKKGTQEVDEFGDTVYLEASYVHASLIQALRDMVTAEDMIPLLEKFASRVPWANQILNEVRDNPRLFTSFYRAYRKDYLNYWIQKQKLQADGSIAFQTISINKSEGTSHYFDEWRDNYEFGNILDSDSLYDKNGDIHLDKAKIGLETVNKILDRFSRDATREEEISITNDKETIKDLQKALGMLGISVDDKTLINSLNHDIDDSRFPLPISIILDSLRTIYYDLNKGNEKVIDGKSADLINIYGTAYNNIAEVINKVDEDSVESNVRQGDKTRYAHVNPSYLTTLIKKLKRDDFVDFINREYKSVEWFYDKRTGWKNEWLKELESNSEAREQLSHVVVLESNKKEYNRWDEVDAVLVLINQYFSSPTKNEEGYAYYQVPMLSDSQSAEFIKGKRYIDNFEEIVNSRLVVLVKQEIDRISLVNKRFNTGVDEIANYDRVKKKDGTISIGGAEFKFFPELNRAVYGDDNNRTFLDVYNELVKSGATQEAIDEFIRSSISTIMEDRFTYAKNRWQQIGLLDRIDSSQNSRYKYFVRYSEKGVERDLREWYWNSTFAQSQIIQLLTTDLAYYKNLEDFQKRNKQVHAPSEKLNTFATWNKNGVEVPVLERVPLKDAHGNDVLDSNGNRIMVPRKERCIYLKDHVVTSAGIKDIEEIIDAKIKKGELTKYDKAVILGTYKKVNVADAQAYRTLDSFRATQIMADMWSDEEEEAYNNFKNNKWSARDFTVLWNTRKPYLYTQTNQSNQVDDGLIRVSTQHKNSEMLLLTQAIFGEIISSGKMRALQDFMESNHIDVAHFESVVKDGKQGVIDINDIGDDDYQGTISKLSEAISNPNYVHEFDYNDYGIQTATPEHGIDAIQLVGTQIRRLIGADMNPNAKFSYDGREWTVEQWFNYFNAVNVANIRTAFESLEEKFKDVREIEKELLREVRSNPRYGTDLIQALSLNDRGEFNIPLDDPSQTLRIQALLNSIIKSKVTKQKIAGGALIQASCYGLSKKPKIVYDGEGENKRVKYIECYIPCPTEELYNLLLDSKTHELDVNKKDKNGNYIVPRKYLEVIGYRVPTEDKYSMAPLRVIGFLPRQVGSVIILPEEITAIAGSDFDVDKMYVMFHTLNFKDNYDIKRAWDDFYRDPSNSDIVSEIDRNFGEALDRYIKEQTEDWNELPDEDDLEEFKREFRGWLKKEGVKKYSFSEEAQKRFINWFKSRKASYLLDKSLNVSNFNFDNNVSNDDKNGIYNIAKSQTKRQRDSLIIDLIWSVLTNSDTAGRFINPGGFNEQKRSARIASTLDALDLTTFKQQFRSVEEFLSIPLESKEGRSFEDISEEFKETLNPLTPDTWVSLHQRNMAGASLIGIAANHNASHAIMQRTRLGISPEYSLKFNGVTYSSLHDTRNANGQFITRNIAGFLAAFVDNAKDPIAGDMNFNSKTADMAFTLLRMGVPVVTTTLILKQPIIVDIVNTANRDYVSMQEALSKVLATYKNKAGGENVHIIPSQKGINNYNFTDEELVTNILASHNPSTTSSNIEEATFYSNQVKIGYVFSKLNKLATALGDLTQATRADTQNGAAGPSIADNVIKIERVEDVLEASSKPNYPLTNVTFINFNMSEEEVINSDLPVLQAFFTYGIESTERLFSGLFPQYSASYRGIIGKLKGETKYNRLSVKTRNSIYNDLISYYISQFPEFSDYVTVTDKDGKKVEVSARDYYINYFPAEFKKFKEDHNELAQLSFINRLKVIGYTKYNPVASIIFTNVGKVTPLQKEQYIREWTNMLYINDQTREMARKLFIYNCFKGFGFSPSGFSHLASTIIKMDNAQYIRGLKDVTKINFDVANFWRQYILNHLDNRELVPDVSDSSVEIDSDTTEFSITIDINSPYEDKQFAHPFSEDDEIVYHSYVHFNIKGRDVYFEYNEENNTYYKVKPLGLKNQYVEYEYGISSEEVSSVIPDIKSNKVSFNDIYDDTTPVEVEESFEYADIGSLGLGEIVISPETVTAPKAESRIDYVKSILDKYSSITPNNTDEFTGEDYCVYKL